MTDIVRKYLYDIKNCIKSIYVHLDNEIEFKKYTSNLTRKRAVERELEIESVFYQ